jgi:CubicO group peptidase (beta-lactamase class C family)
VKSKLLFLSLQILYVINLNALVNGKKIDSYLKNCKNFSGAVLITQKGKIILKKGYGYASYEFDIPTTSHTKFPIASNTKSFTALAVMQLQEKNLLNVHDTLNKYIPDFHNGDKITLHHLLTHTSGIQNYYKNWDDLCNCKNLEGMINAIKSWSLEFEPGTRYQYSNTGYLLLAYIIEKISGISFEVFVAENIFKPCKMYTSGSITTGLMIKNKASGYTVKDTMLYNAPSITNPMSLLGNGDLYSSLDDMFAFNEALHGGKILSKKNLDSMFTPHRMMENSVERAHGYGWFIDRKCGKRIVEYSGALEGFLSKVMRFIDDDITIIILTNREDRDQFGKICDNLPEILFGI